MAEFKFVMGPDDQAELIQFFLDIGAELVPGIHYDSPEYLVIRDVFQASVLIQQRLIIGPIFVSWEGYKQYPYEMRSIDKNGKTIYYLQQRVGGPYLDILESRYFYDEGGFKIIPGTLGLYPRFWIEELQEEIPASEEIKDEYKKAKKFIRQHSRMLRTDDGQRFWIGKQALRLIQDGIAVCPWEEIQEPLIAGRGLK